MGLNEVRRHEDKSGDDMFEDLAELLSDHGYSGAYQPAMRYPSQGVRIYIYIYVCAMPYCISLENCCCVHLLVSRSKKALLSSRSCTCCAVI